MKGPSLQTLANERRAKNREKLLAMKRWGRGFGTRAVAEAGARGLGQEQWQKQGQKQEFVH